MYAFFLILALFATRFLDCNGALSIDELERYAKYRQQTRNTFDSRIPQKIKPIGFVGDE
jgi:hypothetical protein